MPTSADPNATVANLAERATVQGTARVLLMDEKVLRRFSRYARGGPRTLGIDPKLIRVDLSEDAG